MKILLLGEFSGLHKYLKEGLLELGADAKIASIGDGYKKIGGADFQLFDISKQSLIPKITERLIKASSNAKQFKGYDVLQLINPIIYNLYINKKLLKRIIGQNNMISLVAAGGEYSLYQKYKSRAFEYYVYDYDKSCEKKYGNSASGRRAISSCIFVEEKADIVIPALYEYAIGHSDNPKCHNVIPLPINTDSIEYAENTIGSKIVFFHGLNKELAKGTKFIREAMERLKENYPDEVEIILDGHMPFDKYIELMKKTNVIIDQCCSYGYGINACIAMAQGKVVLSGARKETLDAFGINKCPIFGIKPDADQIYEKLEYIVKNRNMIPQWGYESRQYVENIHHYVKIAQKYIDAWRSTGKL